MRYRFVPARKLVRQSVLAILSLSVGIIAGAILFGNGLWSVRGAALPGTGFVAVPGEIGGQDLYGPYEVVPDWPKPLATLPGHDGYTWGAAMGVFAESPNRVFISQRGELPIVPKPPNPNGNGSYTTVPALLKNSSARFDDHIVVVNAKGDIIETWTQWDKMLKVPHCVEISPYDPEKSVWVTDEGLTASPGSAIYKFSNDGKKLLLTIGVPNEPGDDDKHLNRPEFIAWLPDGTMFVADISRVVKYDKDGKFLLSWGQKGNPPNDTRPGYFNLLHSIAVDPKTRRVYVNDRGNRRIQVFDENGKFLEQWSNGPYAQMGMLYLSGKRELWQTDEITSRILKYDLQGHFLYSWGTMAMGDYPGLTWGTHAMSVDQEGNLYLSEVFSGQTQKFRPRKGANPEFLVGQPVRAAWK
jgi:hypothetical protein